MAKIVTRNVLTVGGLVPKLIGVQVGDFLLKPDNDSGMKPNVLRIHGSSRTVVVEGGRFFQVRVMGVGDNYRAFQERLSDEQRKLLVRLSSDLGGYIWPSVEEVMLKRINGMGEKKVLRALKALFNGVETTMIGVKFCNVVPFIGKRLEERFFPVT